MSKTFAPPRQVANGVVVIDTGYERPGCAAAYLVRGKTGAAFVETGTGHSVPRLLEALPVAGLRREDITHVIPTHVHLDHAGGVGGLMSELPRATLVVHPRGAKHMIDPSKLIAGAAEVYGGLENMERFFGRLLPVPKERVVEAPDGFSVDLGDRQLEMWDAPGHAQHHFVVFDHGTRGLFTGDTFGLCYRELDNAQGPFIFPTTTPVQFDPPALHASVRRMLAAKPDHIFFTHFGMVAGADVIQRIGAELDRMIDGHVALAEKAKGAPDRHGALKAGIEQQLVTELAHQGTTLSRDELYAVFGGDIDLNAQGLGVWLDKQAKAQGKG